MGVHRTKHVLAEDGVELSWVCSRDAERAKAFIREMSGEVGVDGGTVRGISDWQAALDEVDGVIFTTPNARHRDEATTAVAAGKHVFVEYPHATTTEDGRAVVQAAQRAGVGFHVGLTHHFSRRHRRLRALCRGEDARLGKIRSYVVSMCSGNPISRWFDKDELSGGMFVASMYHHIDEAVDLIGEVRSLSAYYTSERDAAGVIRRDCADLTLGFATGAVAHVTYARGYPKPGLGTRRAMIFEGGYVDLVDDGILVRTPDGDRTLPIEGDDALLADTRAFFAAARASAPNATLAAAQRSLEVAARAQREARHPAG
jgi:predicted dehydrogenase